MEKFFSYEEMDKLINDGEVEVIKRSQKPSSCGLRRHLEIRKVFARNVPVKL